LRFFFDIGHPAHVHYFRNVIELLGEDGHDVLVTSRDKDIALELLDLYRIPYVNRGAGATGLVGKAMYLARTDLWMLKEARSFDPHVLVGFSSPYPAHVATWLGRPYVGITDTESSVWQQRLFVPFSRHVLTPTCFGRDLGEKHQRFDSYMELAYLGRDWFSPDPAVLGELGVGLATPFVIIRFVGWEASHDRGHSGLSLEHKRVAVEQLSRMGSVFISSEKPLPEDLEAFRCPLPVDRIHHALAYASLLYGESCTMASEAAVLGTAAVYHDDVGRGYTDEQESVYGHVSRFSEDRKGSEQGLAKACSIMADPHAKRDAQAAATRIHADKVDTSRFLYEFLLQTGEAEARSR